LLHNRPGSFTGLKIHEYFPKTIQTVKNHQGKKTDMKSNPSWRGKTVNNLIVIPGGIPAGTKMKGKKMDRHPYYQQQSGNPLQEP
jgi:hypothetical protein